MSFPRKGSSVCTIVSTSIQKAVLSDRLFPPRLRTVTDRPVLYLPFMLPDNIGSLPVKSDRQPDISCLLCFSFRFSIDQCCFRHPSVPYCDIESPPGWVTEDRGELGLEAGVLLIVLAEHAVYVVRAVHEGGRGDLCGIRIVPGGAAGDDVIVGIILEKAGSFAGKRRLHVREMA